MICGGSTFACYMFLRAHAIESPLVPCLIVAVLSYFTASIFMQVSYGWRVCWGQHVSAAISSKQSSGGLS